MTLEELQDQASKDLAIDETQLDIESLSTPTLHSKYLKIYSTYALMLKKEEGDYSKLHVKKWLFFLGKAEPEEYQKENFDRKIFLVLGYFFSSNEAKAVSRASFMLEKSAFISSAISRAVP